jgi:hypothetical protein
MLDGFNEGWIEFEKGEASSRKGEVALKTVLQMFIEQERKRSHAEGECLEARLPGSLGSEEIAGTDQSDF